MGIVLAIAASAAGLVWAEAPVTTLGPVQGEALNLAPLASRGGRLYSVIAGGLYFSIDGGAEWKRQPAASAPLVYPASLAADPGNALVLYMGTNYNGLFKSVDGGMTFFRASTGLGAGTQSGRSRRFTCRHFIPAFSLVATAYWVGTSQRDLVPQGLYLSSNAGQSWFQFSDAVGATAITILDLDSKLVVTAASADGSIQRIPLDEALSGLMQYGTAEQQAHVPPAMVLLGVQPGCNEGATVASGAARICSTTAARLAFLGTPAAIRTLVGEWTGRHTGDRQAAFVHADSGVSGREGSSRPDHRTLR